MSTLIQTTQGYWGGVLDVGVAALVADRVVTPNLRFGSDPVKAVLLIDEPADGPDWGLSKLRNVRTWTPVGLKIINQSSHYGDPYVAYFIELEFANLGGDMSLFNGSHLLLGPSVVGIRLGWHPGVRVSWYFQGPFLFWDSEIPRWYATIQGRSDRCRMVWNGVTTSEGDPEGDYTKRTCVDSACNDGNTCALSASATCRVRWAGATWP